MYEDLLKDLRGCREGSCQECRRGNRHVTFIDCMTALMEEAANAIEELQAQLMYSNDAAKEIAEKVPKWIPVTERLPKDGEFVLVCNDDKHMMIAKYETETYEWYYKYTNYDFDIWDNEEQGPVCYWMPLPEPPKEE